MPTGRNKIRPLTDEPPLLVRPHLAAAMRRHKGGLEDALLLDHLWAMTQAGGGRVRRHDGTDFVYYPLRDMLLRLRGCLSRSTLQRVLARLKHAGLIHQARLKHTGKDADAWYAVDREAVAKVCSLFSTAPADEAGDDPVDDGGGDPDPHRDDSPDCRIGSGCAGDEPNLTSTRGQVDLDPGSEWAGQEPNLTSARGQSDLANKEQVRYRTVKAPSLRGRTREAPPPPDVPPPSAPPELAAAAALLVEEGYEPDDARRVAERWGARRVRVAVGNFRLVRKSRRPIYSPRGWIQSAIERGDEPLRGTPLHAAAPPVVRASPEFNVRPAAEVSADAKRTRRHRELEATIDALSDELWQGLAERLRPRWARQWPDRPFPADSRRHQVVRAMAIEFLHGPTPARQAEVRP
jgi:hypothetical protein